ncbi:MAG: Flp family type IVb pilin [Terracidiphilus sp.]
MVSFLHSLFFRLRHGFLRTEGQDLIEYALLAALISCGAVAGMQNVASDLSAAFTHLSATFNSLV